MKNQFKDFVMAEYSKVLTSDESNHLNQGIVVGEDLSARDSIQLQHREKNIFLNKKKSRTHLSSSNMP